MNPPEIQPAKFDFNREFQIKVLALLQQDFDFLIMGHDIIQPNYFTDPILVWFFKSLRDHYLDYQMRMEPESLWNEMKKDAKNKRIKKDQLKDYISVYKRMKPKVGDKEYIATEVTNFCKTQAVRVATVEMIPMLSKGDLEGAQQVMAKAFNIGAQTMDLGSQYFTRWPERIGNRAIRLELRTIPTGITELDLFMGGGLRSKQVGIFMAPTNRGKSIALVHVGKRAVIQRYRVVHYTLELSAEDVEERYDASFSGIKVHDLVDMEAELAHKMEHLGRTFGNTLIVKEFPTKTATVATLRSHLRQLAAINFVPDLVTVDYLDLLKPSFRRKEKREELSDITEELRGMAGELEIPIWTATQSRRSAISKETHDEEDAAEDIGKMNIADIVVTLNQTKAEATSGAMRLLLAKNRNGPRYVSVPIQGEFARMCFYEPEKEHGAQEEVTPITKTPPARRLKKTPPFRRKAA